MRHTNHWPTLLFLAAIFAGCTVSGSGGGVKIGGDPPLSLSDKFYSLGNPIISQRYTADPAVCVFNNRVYVYMSHDLDEQNSYQMYDMTIISSDDLANWTDHLEPFTVPACAAWANLAWAPTVVYRDNKYYLYFGNGASGIGVVTSDNPTGPWTDPRGSALVTRSTPGAEGVQWCFDPTVFVDDDGQAYLYFGGGGPGNSRVIRLKSDMISVNGSAQEISGAPDHFFEAAYMHKHNGQYYFSYSSDFSQGAARIDYMMSDNPLTGFEYKGSLFDGPPDNQGNNNHASLVEFNGAWYLAYHNRRQALLDHPDPSYTTYHRSVCLERLTYNPDGTIIKVISTEQGVPQIKYIDPFIVNQAETMHRQYGLTVKKFLSDITAVGDINAGNAVKYKGVDFGAVGANGIEIRFSGAASGFIDIFLDLAPADGTLIGTCAVAPTGDQNTWNTGVYALNQTVTGVHDLYFKFRGSGYNLFNVDWWKFN